MGHVRQAGEGASLSGGSTVARAFARRMGPCSSSQGRVRWSEQRTGMRTYAHTHRVRAGATQRLCLRGSSLCTNAVKDVYLHACIESAGALRAAIVVCVVVVNRTRSLSWSGVLDCVVTLTA